MEVNENLIVAIVGVAGTLLGTTIGWGLTQISEWKRGSKKITLQKKAIYIELADCVKKLEEATGYLLKICEETCSYSPNAYVAYPTPIQLSITNKNFFEIYVHFDEAERANVGAILDYAISYNDALKQAEFLDPKETSTVEYLNRILVAYATAKNMRAFTEAALSDTRNIVKQDANSIVKARKEIENKVSEFKSKLAKRFSP